MDYSDSVLSDLQREVLAVLGRQGGFYITGGAALSAFYLGHRRSYDIDLFTQEPGRVELLARALHLESAEHGWEVSERQRSPGFTRYVVARGEESTVVDLVYEPVPQIVDFECKPRWQEIAYDSLEDIIASKLGSLLGRADVKDLVDLFFLEREGHDVLVHLEAAALKDAGMERTSLAWAIRTMPVDPHRLLLLRSVSSGELSSYRDRLVQRLLEEAWPGSTDIAESPQAT